LSCRQFPIVSRHLSLLVLLVALGGCRTASHLDVPAGTQALVRTELYFGQSIPSGGQVSDAQWDAFLRDEITPRFPDGLTVLTARGQWREGDTVIREPSRIVILLHPGTRDTAEKIEAIRSAYKSRFNQTSVLRTDDRVHASF
jgi:hypothetical protein